MAFKENVKLKSYVNIENSTRNAIKLTKNNCFFIVLFIAILLPFVKLLIINALYLHVFEI